MAGSSQYSGLVVHLVDVLRRAMRKSLSSVREWSDEDARDSSRDRESNSRDREDRRLAEQDNGEAVAALPMIRASAWATLISEEDENAINSPDRDMSSLSASSYTMQPSPPPEETPSPRRDYFVSLDGIESGDE